MNRLIRVSALIILYTVSVSSAICQMLGEMEVKTVPQEDFFYIVRNQNEAILVVQSAIPNLVFEGNMGIIEVDEPNTGEYIVHVPPGTNIITFKREGYRSIKEQFYIKKKDYLVIEVISKFAAEIRSEIILIYKQSLSDEKIWGMIDSRVMNLNFTRGRVNIKTTPGKHTIILHNGRLTWEKSFELKAKDRIEENVLFSNVSSNDVKTMVPGGLYINSSPSGATVFMNQVEQGQTPLTLEEVTPGTYQIEIVKPLYVTERFDINIEPLSYARRDNITLKTISGTIYVQTVPTGVNFILNDIHRGVTPYQSPPLEIGKYTIRLFDPLYHEVREELEIKSGDKFSKTYNLRPQFGSIDITSDPSGAKVLLDGRELGFTPLKIDTITSGRQIIKLVKDYYEVFEENIEIVDEELLPKHYSLKPKFGLLSIKTEPSNATLIVNGTESYSGTTPLTDFKFSAGIYKVKIEKELYETYVSEVIINRGASKIIDTILKRKTGNLRVSTNPQGAKIFLNGEQIGISPTVITDYPTGIYDIRLDRSGFDILIDKVTVNHNQTTAVVKSLSTEGTLKWLRKKNKARKWAFIVPGSGQFISKQNMRGFIYGATLLGSAAMTTYSLRKHSDSKSKYDQEYNAYSNAKSVDELVISLNGMEKELDNMNKYKLQANLAIFSALGIYVLQALDAWIWGGGERPIMISEGNGLAPVLFADDRHIQIGLEFNF